MHGGNETRRSLQGDKFFQDALGFTLDATKGQSFTLLEGRERIEPISDYAIHLQSVYRMTQILFYVSTPETIDRIEISLSFGNACQMLVSAHSDFGIVAFPNMIIKHTRNRLNPIEISSLLHGGRLMPTHVGSIIGPSYYSK